MDCYQITENVGSKATEMMMKDRAYFTEIRLILANFGKTEKGGDKE